MDLRIVVVAAKQLRFRVGRKNGAHHPDSILRVCKIIYRWTSFFSRAPFYFFDGWFSQNALLELAHASHERHVYECRQSGTTSISESHPTPFAVLLVATTTAGYSQGGKP